MTPTPASIWSLETRVLGRRVHVYDSLESTNALALELSDEPARHGLVLLAREQTAGRGQYGRHWLAPPGSSVLLSMLLFPPPHLRRPPLLTAWAAVSVCETIRKLVYLTATIKWPNDILLQDKKVCGILIEQRTTGHPEFPLAAAVGIGLNLIQSADDFAGAGLPLAGSLCSQSGIECPLEDAARELIHQLDAHYHSLQDDHRPLESQWRQLLGLVGKVVIVEGNNQRHRGRLLDMTLARVSIEIATGESLHIAPESVLRMGAV
jgi:BirA family biotin operon repressor/biotin-[acetyl-CoA-carboxylase] ligase